MANLSDAFAVDEDAIPTNNFVLVSKFFPKCVDCQALAYKGIKDLDFTHFEMHRDNRFGSPCVYYRKQRVGNGKPSGLFAFTLTKSPKDPLSIGDMLVAVRKIMSQKSCKVIRYAWYYEDKGRDENGDAIHPHIHGLYETETGGRIEAKHFKRAWSVWDEKKPLGAGFQGGYHRPVRSEEGYGDYIKKDGHMGESFGV